MYLYVIRMSLVGTPMSSVCYSYVLVCTHMSRMSLLFTLRHPYVIRMHSYATRMSLVCTRMSSVSYSYLLVCTYMSYVCHSYILVCHPYVTRMYMYVIRMSFVCGFTMDVLVIPILQETKNSNLFDKNCTQENVKCHNQHEENDLNEL